LLLVSFPLCSVEPGLPCFPTRRSSELIRTILGDRPVPIRMGAYEDWIPNEDLMEKGWEVLKKEFYGSAEQLCELLRAKDDPFLRESPKGLEETYLFFLDGLINHDIYHLGQI